MNNKHALCYRLYKSYKENSLYYFKGILYSLATKDRNYDIYIDTTTECYDILQKIIKQENYCIDNVYYILHNNEDLNKSYWTIQTIYNIYNKYDIIGYINSSYEIGENYFSKIEKLNYGIFHRQEVSNNNFISCYGLNNLNTNFIFFKTKNIKTDIIKLKYCIDKILDIKDYVYNIDDNILESLFIKDIYENNVCRLNSNVNYNKDTDYITPTFNIYTYSDIIWFYIISIQDSSLYYNKDNKTYTIDGIDYKYDYVEPESYSKFKLLAKDDQKYICNAMYGNRFKNLKWQIERYMLNYSNSINVERFKEHYKDFVV